MVEEYVGIVEWMRFIIVGIVMERMNLVLEGGCRILKTRLGFVSNSSSASFVVRLKDFKYSHKLKEAFEEIEKEFSDWFLEIFNDCVIASNISDSGVNLLACLDSRYEYHYSVSLNYWGWRSVESLKETAMAYNPKKESKQ